MKNYDVILTITNVEAKDEAEAVEIAREEARIPDRGYVDVKEVK